VIPIRNVTGPEDQPPIGTLRTQPNSAEGGHSAVVELANARPYKLLVTPEKAAEILSVGRTRIFELMASGELRSVRIRSSRRIPMVAIEQLVQQLLDKPEGGQE
jgi:excisionase family DNA binding protein